MNKEKETKLDTSFDLLKTDGFDLSSVGIKKVEENDESTDEKIDEKTDEVK